MTFLGDNPNGAQVFQTGIAFVIVDTLAVLLRLLARWRSKASFAVDDLLIVASILPFYGMVIETYLAITRGGLGMPTEKLEPSQLPVFLQILMSTMVTYALTMTLVKISILFLYRRIFATPAFQRKSLVVGSMCVAWCFAAIFVDIFQCHPVKAAFDPRLLSTHQCLNLKTFFLPITVVNVALDIIILYLPLHEVWNLEMPSSKKVKVSGIFLLGSIVCITGLMRIVEIICMGEAEITLGLLPEFALSQAEPATAIFAGCVVTYRPLFADLGINLSRISSLFSGTGYSNKRGHGSGSSSSEEKFNQWGWHQERDYRLQKLNVKSATNGLHVVQIDLGISDPEGQVFYQQPRSRHDVRSNAW